MRLRRFWIGCGFAFVALVIYLSLTPNPVDTGRIEDVKTGHFIAYAWLMWWFGQIYTARPTRIATAFALILLGVALEYAQGLTGYRTFAYSDMRDNALGVLMGWIIAATPFGRSLLLFEASYFRLKARGT